MHELGAKGKAFFYKRNVLSGLSISVRFYTGRMAEKASVSRGFSVSVKFYTGRVATEVRVSRGDFVFL